MNLKRLVFAAIITMLPFSAYAHGRHHHHHRHVRHRHHAVHPLDIRPHVQANAERLIRVARHDLGKRNFTGLNVAWCKAGLDIWMHKAGLHPNKSLLAADAARMGPHTHPQRGAVIVFPHHVGIIERIRGSLAWVISANHSHRVGEGWYPLRRAIAFVWPV